MSDFDFGGLEASYHAQQFIEGKASRADAIRNLVIDGADEDEATEFIDATNSEIVASR